MPSKATRLRMLNDVRRRIDDYGWAVQAIGDQCAVPGCCSHLRRVRDFADFGYVVGLSRYHGHPKLIVTGVPQMQTVRPDPGAPFPLGSGLLAPRVGAALLGPPPVV